MKRVCLFMAAVLNLGGMLVQVVALVVEFATAAPASLVAFSVLALMANAVGAAWSYGEAREVRP